MAIISSFRKSSRLRKFPWSTCASTVRPVFAPDHAHPSMQDSPSSAGSVSFETSEANTASHGLHDRHKIHNQYGNSGDVNCFFPPSIGLQFRAEPRQTSLSLGWPTVREQGSVRTAESGSARAAINQPVNVSSSISAAPFPPHPLHLTSARHDRAAAPPLVGFHWRRDEESNGGAATPQFPFQKCFSHGSFEQQRGQFLLARGRESHEKGQQCAAAAASAAAGVHDQAKSGDLSADERRAQAVVSSEADNSGDEEGSRIAGGSRNTAANAAPLKSSSSSSSSSSWVDLYLPASAQPFAHLARLDKPIGTWLLAWPCCWSIALAAPPGSPPDLPLLLLFGAGAVLLRGAGCTVNDLLDQRVDAMVERTRTRPLPAGAVTTLGAVTFLGMQLLLGLGILVQLNSFSQLLGAASLPLVFSYPLMKRVTYWPQAYLGLVFNWGALLGWAAVHGSLHLPAVAPLYMGGVFWTLVYDTIYAHQDKSDDVTAGVKSTALLFADRTHLWLSLFGASSIACLTAAGAANGLSLPFYGSLAVAGAHLAWQVGSTDYNSRRDCNKKFASNWTFGALVFGGIVAGKMVGA